MVTVYFATNRNLINASNSISFGENFSSTDLGDLRFGHMQVNEGVLDSSTIQILPDNPEEGSRALFDQLRKTMREQSLDSLIFVHGFNNSFKNAIESAAEMSSRYTQLSGQSYNPNIFVFSWPSNGRRFEYKNDRHDAETSGYAFARGLEKLANFLREKDGDQPCQQRINLMAYSMGGYVLRHTLQQIQKISGSKPLPRLFDNIILTAADEDNDAFEHDYKLARLPEIGKHVTIYCNVEDRALSVSDITKGNPDRLGHDGPRTPHDLPYKVAIVDVSDVVRGFSEHSYHVDDDNVVKDIISVL
jgi:esterase/lipase superfamily enzyme